MGRLCQHSVRKNTGAESTFTLSRQGDALTRFVEYDSHQYGMGRQANDQQKRHRKGRMDKAPDEQDG